MLAHLGGSVEAPSRRRSDTYNSTGLDYSTCSRIEEDISTRIRSLLLSRHTYYPSRTPWSSDEMASRHQEDYDGVESFDFNTAKSVAESARFKSGMLSLPSKLAPDIPYVPEMLPVSGRNKRPDLRSSSPTNNLCAMNRSLDGVDSIETGQAMDDAMIHKTLLTCCLPCPPGKGDKTPLGFRELVSNPGIRISHEDGLTATSSSTVTLGLKVKDALGDSLQLFPRSEKHFSLPGPSIRLVASRSSLRLKDRAPSLQTAGSKSLAHRHALLKPSVTAWQPVDLGLPVQPVLINAPDMLPTSGSTGAHNNATAGHSHIHPQKRPVEALTSLLELPQSKESAGGDKQPKTAHQATQTDSIASAYLPTVKLAVEVATQNAVGPVVYQAVSSAAGELNQAPDAYRSLAPEPLAEAALRDEEYLRRNFSWGDELSTRREEAEIGSIREHTGRVLSVSSIALQNAPSNVVPEDVASFGNLTPQESLEMRMVVPETKGAGEGSNKRSWKIAPWKHSSQESPFKYSTIPPRKSSLDTRTPISRKSFKNVPYRNHFLEQLVSKAGRGVRSTSSLSSSRINSSIPRNPQHLPNDEGEFASADTYDDNLGVNWPRELLSDHEPYTTRLTAIPPRKRRLPRAILKSAQRSGTRSDAVVTVGGPSKQPEPGASEAFTRTINELENLMNEALHIARQAAEREDAEQLPGLLHDATTIHDIIRQRAYKRGRLGSVLRSQLPDMLSYQESVHESALSASSDSESHHSDISNYIYEERYPRTPSEFARQSDGNMVVAQPAVMPRTQSTRPLSRASTPQAVPVLAGLKAIATGLLHKTVHVKISEKVSPSDRVSITSMTAGVPTIRDGNAESSTHIKSENHSELLHEEHLRHEQATAIKPQQDQRIEKRAPAIRQPYGEDVPTKIKAKRPLKTILNKREVTEFIRVFHQPPIESRHSSLALRKTVNPDDKPVAITSAVDHAPNGLSTDVVSLRSKQSVSLRTLSSSQGTVSEADFSTPQGFRQHAGPAGTATYNKLFELKDSKEGGDNVPKRHISGRRLQDKHHHFKHDKLSHLNLRCKSHISLRDHKGFSLSRPHRRQPIARDWSPGRKRFAASVACISTALVGILVGIYAGEVPSIQYYIADFYHCAILGNVFFFITLAVTTFLFWPLPLLHGRKPYILAALTVAMPLLFPQAIAVSVQRSPYVATWRVALILPRTFMGVSLGFANINFMATLTDLFGASLQSGNPHQETVDECDVRRHGGGLGVWLGIWTWCYIGSIGVGFLVGALVINSLSPDWGFYISIVIIATVMLLNVVTPEVRRSAYRRSVAEVQTGTDISRRLARGEVMMHRLQTGPKWWGEEFHQGVMLSLDMLRQPGFLVMSLYVAWMYGQIVLVIVVCFRISILRSQCSQLIISAALQLLGSLMSKYYHFTSPAVGASTMAIPLGALLAVPFQKASLFSRARRRPQRTDSMTFDTKVTFSSHLVRRAIFTLVLPFAGLAYTLSSAGPPTHFILPVLFAGLIGFLSNLAIAECNGILMETFDTSDLQSGMTGRPRGSSGERTKHKRTNYSSFPRVSSAFAIIQALGFLLGAAATGVGGVAERHIGQQAATGVMAGILLILTVGVLGVLYRFKEVQIIPSHNEVDMEKWETERKMSIQRQEEAVRQGAPDDRTPELEEPWRPIIIGNPSGKTRRMSILELGHLSRWSEIRRKNKLINEMSYEARHPNLATLEDVRKEIRDKNLGSLHRGGSRRSQRSRRSQLSQGSEEPEAHAGGGLGERSKSS